MWLEVIHYGGVKHTGTLSSYLHLPGLPERTKQFFGPIVRHQIIVTHPCAVELSFRPVVQRAVFEDARLPTGRVPSNHRNGNGRQPCTREAKSVVGLTCFLGLLVAPEIALTGRHFFNPVSTTVFWLPPVVLEAKEGTHLDFA
ncbi:hypothetical protein B0H16DRAFT_1453384 [Mycena metata]|uniref:Uncharacterized protein n=1 Tax=Mycena metata TaxID=1033252 RepID=A0AAD7JR40_9AGAR|nr:hypothetical protein B0H16DRAFT_1453384 [Mycena metata]